jgi:hypothetical protein
MAVVTALHEFVAASPETVYCCQSECPSVDVLECLVFVAHAPTPWFACSSSSLALQLPYPSSYLMPSANENMEDYRMAREENKHDKYLRVIGP